MDDIQKLRSVGINVTTMQKGDFYPREQVEEAFFILVPKADEMVAAYERGERDDPRSFACQKVITAIEHARKELGLPGLVLRAPGKGVKVLTDSEAVPYLNSQANAGLRKHKNKSTQLFTHVDATQLSEKEKKQLEADQRRHAFIAAAIQGSRTQTLKMQRKGLQIPDCTDS